MKKSHQHLLIGAAVLAALYYAMKNYNTGRAAGGQPASLPAPGVADLSVDGSSLADVASDFSIPIG